MNEEWRTYPVDDRYEVSSFGNVRRIGNVENRAVKHASRLRYAAVTFHFCGAHVSRYVHDMVLTTFHGPRPEGCEASHLDGNASNNRADNLIWESRADNLARRKTVKLRWEDVVALRAGTIGIRALAQMRGVRADSLYKVRRGVRWPATEAQLKERAWSTTRG
jgi:hypothetical protein